MTKTETDVRIDIREQLYNDRRTGLIHEVQFPVERITTLHGLMIDLDPHLYIPDNAIFPPDPDPRKFYENIKCVLARHPVARHAEVRLSGTGLHLLIWLTPPVELHDETEQRRWDHLVRAVQYSLPGDPQAPGITAVTRSIGSINSKNDATVELLHSGEPVTPGDVESYVERLIKAPFREVVAVLLGTLRVEPCPVCRRDGSRLDVLDLHGTCYGGCGRVNLETLLDQVYASPEMTSAAPKKGPTHARRSKT